MDDGQYLSKRYLHIGTLSAVRTGTRVESVAFLPKKWLSCRYKAHQSESLCPTRVTLGQWIACGLRVCELKRARESSEGSIPNWKNQPSQHSMHDRREDKKETRQKKKQNIIVIIGIPKAFAQLHPGDFRTCSLCFSLLLQWRYNRLFKSWGLGVAAVL